MGRNSHLENKIIILAASLGGPPLVNDILSGLPPDFDLPILVLQHMESDFSEPLTAAWSKTSALDLVRLNREVRLTQGSAYVVPHNMYPVFESTGSNVRIKPKALTARGRLNEQWECALRECARQFDGNTILILLTNNEDENCGIRNCIESLSDAGGTIIYCRESFNLIGAEADDRSRSTGRLEMEIDQIVGLLQEISRNKQFNLKGMLNSGGR
jgi:two-component system chemotaxis response regulator CheB